MEPFQTQAQLRALRIHTVLDRFYTWLAKPFTYLFDFNTRAVVEMDKTKPSLKVVR